MKLHRNDSPYEGIAQSSNKIERNCVTYTSTGSNYIPTLNSGTMSPVIDKNIPLLS